MNRSPSQSSPPSPSSVLDDLLAALAPAPRAAAQRALVVLVQGLDPDAALDVPHIDRHLVELDRRLFAQLDAILHHPAVQSLEAAWRSLDVLMDRIRFDENIRVEILPCSKQDLLDDLASAPEVTRSGLYFHVYGQAIGTFGGKPYGSVAADYDFTPGAEDITREGDFWRVMTGPTDLHAVRTAVEEAGFKVEEADLTMVAQNLVTLDDKGAAKKVLDLVDALDDLDDVQAVHGNFDIPDDVLAELG